MSPSTLHLKWLLCVCTVALLLGGSGAQRGLFPTSAAPGAGAQQQAGAEMCVQFAALQDKLANKEDPWANVPEARKSSVLNVAPKVADEPMVREVLVQFLKQFHAEMDGIGQTCEQDPMLACSDFDFMLERMAADPPVFLPVEVEDALLHTMPDKVTPLMLKMFWDEYLEECEADIESIAKACSGDCDDDCGVPCTEFEVQNGRVEFDSALTEATLTCDRNYKAITGDPAVDLVSASSTATVKCRKDGTWGDVMPGCYTCEYGWRSSPALPACYRVFAGLSPYAHARAYRKHCLSHKADLASVHSDAELLFVAGLVRRGTALIGYNANPSTGEEIWTDGTPFAYTDWVEGVDAEGECAAVATDGEGNFGMFKEPCETPASTRFVCKRVPSKGSLPTGV